MNSVIQDNGGGQVEQRSLAQTALTAQLEVLALFLPATVWRIAQFHGAGTSSFISIGSTLGSLSDCLDSLTDEGLRGLAHGDFHCQRLSTNDLRRWPDLQTHGIDTVYILPLSTESSRKYYLLGLADAEMLDRQSDVLAHARLCVNALNASLAMYTKLAISETMIQEMQRDVFIDPLTNVMNRAGWANSLLSLESNPEAEDTAIVILDMDLLKQVNDTHGHGAGDVLLQQMAKTVTSVLRGSDIVARMGGDEFAIALRNITPAAAELIIQRLEQGLADVGIQVSMGMAFRSEADALSKAIAIADSRMYSNKRKRAIAERLSVLSRRLES